MNCNRRTALNCAVTALGLILPAGALSTGLFAPSAKAQTATLTNLAYLSRRLDASHADFRAWYINHHAPDFMSFAKAHLARYSQDYVEGARKGDVDFDVISTFGYHSEKDRAAVIKYISTPEGKAVMALHPPIGTKPGPNEDHSGSRTYAIEERLVGGPPRGYDKPGTRKHVAVLRGKGPATTPAAFNKVATDFATDIAAKARGGAVRVTICLAVPEAGRPAPFFDAVIALWPKPDATLADVFDGAPAAIDVVNVLDIWSYDNDLRAS